MFVIGAIFVIVISLSYPTPFETTTYAMGTYVQQTVYGMESEKATSLGANSVVNLENEISWRMVDSDICKLNENAGKDWTEVSDSTYNILEDAIAVSEKSGGAFDLTIAPISQLWNFDDSPTEPPKDELIQKLLPYVDYTQLRADETNNSFSFKSSGYAVDLGAVGKGAACDAVISSYMGTNIDYAIVAVGGSIGTYGAKPFGDKWKIAVRNPDGGNSIGTIEIDGGFVSTSGNYEKYFDYNGKRYHHIIDPSTGYPVENDLTSVTVICDSGTISDALSTACFVKDYEESLSLLKEFNAQAVFVYKDKTVKVTDGLGDSFKISNEEYKIG